MMDLLLQSDIVCVDPGLLILLTTLGFIVRFLAPRIGALSGLIMTFGREHGYHMSLRYY